MKKVVVLLTMALMTFGCGDDGPNGAGGEGGTGGTGGTGGVSQVCGDHECVFTGDTGSLITVVTFAAIPLPATGAVDVLCGANTPDANGKCACDGAFQFVDPLPLTGIGTVCLIPEPAGTCPQGDIDCDGGNDQDVDLEQDHNIGDCEDNADCEAQCTAYCAGGAGGTGGAGGAGGAGGVGGAGGTGGAGGAGPGEVPASFGCEGFCSVAGTPCIDETECGADDTCVGGDPVEHQGVCNCQCLTLGDGVPDGAGDAQLNIGFGINVLLNEGEWGPDGEPCTADDVPSITLPPVCAPFTTTTASTVILNANNMSGSTLPSEPPLSVSGSPFMCTAGLPTTATGAGLRTVADFLDSTLGDLAVAVVLNCQ